MLLVASLRPDLGDGYQIFVGIAGSSCPENGNSHEDVSLFCRLRQGALVDHWSINALTIWYKYSISLIYPYFVICYSLPRDLKSWSSCFP